MLILQPMYIAEKHIADGYFQYNTNRNRQYQGGGNNQQIFILQSAPDKKREQQQTEKKLTAYSAIAMAICVPPNPR